MLAIWSPLPSLSSPPPPPGADSFSYGDKTTPPQIQDRYLIPDGFTKITNLGIKSQLWVLPPIKSSNHKCHNCLPLSLLGTLNTPPLPFSCMIPFTPNTAWASTLPPIMINDFIINIAAYRARMGVMQQKVKKILWGFWGECEEKGVSEWKRW